MKQNEKNVLNSIQSQFEFLISRQIISKHGLICIRFLLILIKNKTLLLEKFKENSYTLCIISDFSHFASFVSH